MTSKNSESKPKLPRLSRVPEAELPGFTMTPRDVEILQTIYQYRAVTTPQINALFFQDAPEWGASQVSSRCLNRLKLLFQHRYIYRAERPQTVSEGRKPLVYWLDERGAQYLADLEKHSIYDMDWSLQERSVKWPFLEHLLLTNDVRTVLTVAARTKDFTLPIWHDERTLKRNHAKDKVRIKTTQGHSAEVSVIPDAYFLLDTTTKVEDGYKYHCFIEMDRGTETAAASTDRCDWTRKIQAYLEYYRSGKYHQRYHVTSSMRVLTVTTTPRRLQTLKEATEKAGGVKRFWFTTIDKITPDTILETPIWQVAGTDREYSLIW